MANASNLTVAVEPTVHKVLAETVQAIFDQHGIRVDEVKFEWLDVSDMHRARQSLTSVCVRATTFP